MLSVIKTKNLRIETIQEFKPKPTKTRNRIVERKSSAKTFKSWLQASIRLYREEHKHISTQKIYSSDEIICLLDTIDKKYNELNIEKKNLEKQHLKSSFHIDYSKDIIEVETFMNKSRNVTKIRIIEKNWIESYILEQLNKQECLNSIDVALVFAKAFNYPIHNKRDYYSGRSFQNFWTICLRLLRSEGAINYDAGNITKNLLLEN